MKAPTSSSSADDEVADIERQRDRADLDIVVERPAEDLHARHLHALRPAEHVVDLEEGLEQQREGDGDQRRIMAARAQHRQQQQRADQRRQQPADQQHQQMRHGSVGIEHGRGIGADAEERRAGEIQHARIAELDVQPKRRHGVEQHRDDQQQDEMVLVEIRCRPRRRRRSPSRRAHPRDPRRSGSTGVEPAEPGRGEHRGDRRPPAAR